ncbi:transcriptional regulator, SARP family [Xylanimonas cellulosilytica DSM 15894]|uniref:Transcriptional regulator, SARP family n=1 Tax=Xylanimonas cellulosilytica (strain DSM 15894 / JCM 12276 / CECT 5975 / KCTC 9989 / LMG 20990 / NBRC 107835 / XIL07) TaxID=446471 RepID=D1BTK3_XYLCX|nr:BTAD domain-containing putative transcriptional regulator [Xylanimonas cellulosilytica]ACZ30982.1 transcriptional regulator, SARP family [Xylanimonas cellulosilytica DSM 15894]
MSERMSVVGATKGGTPVQQLRLTVLGGFDLHVDDEPVRVPLAVQRMLALLAVRNRPQSRCDVASTLWMDTTQARATANLRGALWKLGPWRSELIGCDGDRMWLAPRIEVDLTQVVARARRLIGPEPGLRTDDTALEGLEDELLPGWDDEWLAAEREALHQLRVHGLDSLCTRLVEGGRGAEAVCAGQAAVAADPLRESAQRALIAAHLAEGNVSEAWRQYEIYRQLLWESLGLRPSPQLVSLVAVAQP